MIAMPLPDTIRTRRSIDGQFATPPTAPPSIRAPATGEVTPRSPRPREE